jgi:hypothetical protein
VDEGVEVVRGTLAADAADGIRRLWATHGVIEGEAADARLPQVVCVLRDRAGVVVGTCSVVPSRVPMLAGRELFQYRSFVTGGVPAAATYELFNRTFEVLDAEHEPGGAIGLCIDIAPADAARLPRDAIWPETGLIHAGYADDGRQLRVRYFADAVVL